MYSICKALPFSLYYSVSLVHPLNQAPNLVEEEEEDEDAEELGHAETYADYVPSKCKHSISFVL